jgi:ubiquitin C-terminal hydrolase
MSSKYDEDLEITSHRLAPLSSRTMSTVDEDGVSIKPCVLPELLLTKVLSNRAGFFESIGMQQEQLNSYLGSAANKPVVTCTQPVVQNSEAHLVVRRRTSFLHQQSTVVKRLYASLSAAILPPPMVAVSETAVSENTLASTSSSVQSALTMPFNVIKGLVVNTNKSSESYRTSGADSRSIKLRPDMGVGNGCVGLANLGNTCYMSSALQCLSHTPLLRHFFLSGKYQHELNRGNPLGTGGIIAQDFANLLRHLWSSSGHGHVIPTRFKKTLGKLKAQFSGNEQNDTQEFLAELLDMLHEDVNRVTEKRYIQAPSDEDLENMTLAAQAEDAWSRHIARNRSVLVDLFQGQLCSKITCPSCPKISRTYDPFMFLSVPLLPKQHQCKVFVTLLRRMRLPRRRGSSSIIEAEALESYNQARAPSRYCVTLLRLGEVVDLKQEVSRMSGLPAKHMMVVVAKGRRIVRVLNDGESLAEVAELGGNKCLVFEGWKDIPFLSNVSIARFNNRRALLKDKNKSAIESVGSKGYQEQDEYEGSALAWEGDVVVDIGSKQDGDLTTYWDTASFDAEEAEKLFWPASLREIIEGMRVDAMDIRGQWFAGCVEEIRLSSSFSSSPRTKIESPVVKVRKSLSKSKIIVEEYYARIHFDNFSSLWDEWISEEDFRNGRLSRIYSHSERKIKLEEISVVHRRIQTDSTGKAIVELFGAPYVLQCESVRSCRHALRLLEEQSTRYLNREEFVRYLEHERCLATGQPDDYRSPFTVRLLSRHRPLALDRSHNDSTQSSSSKKSQQQELSVQQDWEGTPFPSSAERPLCNINHRQLLVSVDWADSSDSANYRELPYADHDEYISAVVDMNNSRDKRRTDGTTSQVYKAPDAFASFLSHTLHDSVDLHDCLQAFTNAEVLDENTWYCSTCKVHRRGQMQTSIHRLPDILVIHIKRFSMTARRRDKIRTKVVFPLASLNMASYLSSESSETMTNNSVYDLYGVANHIGDMTRGHYTSFINCQVESVGDDIGKGQNERDDSGYESSACNKGRWFLFDDDVVEEVSSNKIVSGNAYVLFYKRRKLTPSNIINLTS